MKPFKIDPTLYYLLLNGVLKGVSGSYVDDLIRCGDEGFRKLSKRTNQTFEMTEESKLPTEVTGFVLDMYRPERILEEVGVPSARCFIHSLRVNADEACMAV